jgi:outer membrane protein OmpA-like peptidoglycan-associated protein
MRQHGIAVLLALLLSVSGAGAQNFAGQIVNLDVPVRDLILPIESLGSAARSISGPTQIEVKEIGTEMRIELPSDILFDFDKSDIRPSAQAALKQVADIVRQRAKGTVRVEGHTDSKGTPAYNQRLSERRAASIQQWLVQREGLRMTPLATQGFGAARPVAPNVNPDGSDNPEGRQRNRRVEIVFGRARSP